MKTTSDANGRRATARRPEIFTLIELLIVVAIIALLMAMLLPALGQAKGFALRSSCAGTIRQLGLAFESYAQDYDGFLPGGGESWMRDIYPYVYSGGSLPADNNEQIKFRQITCPLRIGKRWISGTSPSGYGLNVTISPEGSTMATINLRPDKLSTIRRPSETYGFL